ncbi:MAG: leucine-rich repeat domain-containing protein [Clostridia bacterium]|nr:leucine-rich repeat domain-containing protein [Clostridia bacterium]
MKRNLLISIIIAVLLCAMLSSCVNTGIPEVTSGTPEEETKIPVFETEPEPETTVPPEETTEPPHSDHVYENGSCTECGASDDLSYTVDHESKTAALVSANACKNEKIVVAEYYKGYPVTSITQRAFNLCENVNEIVIPDTMQNLADQTFANCKAETIILGNGIKEIPACAFMDALQLKRVVVGNSLEAIGGSAFLDCESLVEIELPDTVTVIVDNAFANCRSLEYFRIPKGVTELYFATFSNCHSLKEVVFHSGIKSIDYCVFKDCSSLEKLTDFPVGIEYMAFDAFEGAPFKRTEYSGCLYIGSESHPYTVIESYGTPDAESITLHPETRVIAEKAFKGAKFTEIIIPNKVKYIGISAFETCYKITSVTLPNSVKYLGERAFYHCTNLESVTLSESITELYYSAFEGCKKLKELKIPDSVTKIGEKVFDKCESLAVLYIPGSVTELNFSFNKTGIDKIYYSGTLAKWMEIQGNLAGYGGFTVYCSDGEKVY